MPSGMRRFVFTLVFGTAAFGTARFNGEEGARAHLTRLAAGAEHACALQDDGTVVCWGNNDHGQLGDGTFIQRPAPVPIVNLTGVVSIAAGPFHSCAILSVSGAVRCWGNNFDGELGDGTTLSSASPVAVMGLTNVISLAPGFQHTCAARADGTVWCWGANSFGQLGTGTAGGHSFAPVQVAGLAGAVAVTAGTTHTCALLADGVVDCWGINDLGQLGNGSLNTSASPIPVLALAPLSGVGVADVVAIGQSTCARLSDGSLSCWGDNSAAQLGNGGGGKSAVPVSVSLSPTVAAFAVGCAILADGTVSCWGFGSLPSGTGGLPGPPVPGVADATEIATGGGFACALTAGGTILCWGNNFFGQHGNGTTSPSGTDSVLGVGGTFLGRSVAAGNLFTCAQRGSGALACWGAGAQGQLGNSASAASQSPVAVTGITNPIGLSGGSASHACAVDARGAARCWGSNGRGQLGNGTTTSRNQPVKVSGSGLYTAVSAGDAHTCGLTVGGQVFCWGANDRGQLGSGATVDSHTPIAVTGVANAVAIAAGNKFACALIVNGTLRCWGDNSAGQLGDGGAEAFSPTPIFVPSLSVAVALTAGANHACVLAPSGRVFCWGANSRGQMGNNSIQPAPFVVLVQGITDAVSISAGAFFTCAARAGGTASCWGSNDSGELSSIDSADHLTPTAVGTSRFCIFCPGGKAFVSLTGVVAITTGTSTSLPTKQQACALLVTGVIDCWGDNSQGEVGDGSTTNPPRPTAVNSFAANIDPAADLRNGRIAEVTALVDCEVDGRAHIILSLEQGAVSGSGQAEARCEDRLLRVPMTVPAHGPAGFQAGPATAHVEAIVRSDGRIVEDTHWIREVTISVFN